MEDEASLKLPPAAGDTTAYSDPGVTSFAMALVAEVVSSDGWTSVTLPQMVPFFSDFDGEAVFRKEIDVPREEAGKDMILRSEHSLTLTILISMAWKSDARTSRRQTGGEYRAVI